MEMSSGRDLARSLALMLLELKAELDEFAFQVDLQPVESHPDAVPVTLERSLSSQTLF